MIDQLTEKDIDVFASDVEKGLSAKPKYLSSKYFYDSTGDDLFREIMKLPEYYLTKCEYEILTTNRQKILGIIKPKDQEFDLIEFGAGDGFKTKVLLKYFLAKEVDFKYMPIDISENALEILRSGLIKTLPDLKYKPLQGEYFSALESLNKIDSCNKVILFLGSNIGNFSWTEANGFLSRLSDLLNNGDKVIIGFDLKKDPEVIRKAYDDSSGVTRAFNLNLLTRINNELDGNFDLTNFKHYATYNPQSGEARSFLVSKKKQDVRIGKLDRSFHFDLWESIYMEVSQKYDVETINELAIGNGFRVLDNLFDCKHYFVNSVWEKE